MVTLRIFAIGLFLMTSAQVSSASEFGVEWKSFQASEYACFMDSLTATVGAISKIKEEAASWCQEIGGEIGYDVRDTEIIVYNESSPLDGGCLGDVSVKANFNCFLQGGL